MKKLFPFLFLILLCSSAFAFWWITPNIYISKTTSADINGQDINVGTLIANKIDTNSLITNYIVARNEIDLNVLHDANFFGTVTAEQIISRTNVEAQDINANNAFFTGSIGISETIYGDEDENVTYRGKLQSSNSFATHYDAVALGYNTTASGVHSFATGENTIASGQDSIALGTSTIASGQGSVAAGIRTKAEVVTSTALGFQTTSRGTGSIAGGYRSGAAAEVLTTNYASTAIGFSLQAGNGFTSIKSTGIGSKAGGYALGVDDKVGIEASGAGSVAHGYIFKIYANDVNIIASGDGSVAMGHASVSNLTATNTGSIALGIDASSTGIGSFAAGNNTLASGNQATALGENTTASGSGSFAVGIGSTASNTSSFATGVSTSSGAYAFAGGSAAEATGQDSFAFGEDVSALQQGAIAMGVGVVGGKIYSRGYGSVALGFAVSDEVSANGTGAVSIGYNTKSFGQGTVALGSDTNANGTSAIAIGENCNATTANAICLGKDLTNYNANVLVEDLNVVGMAYGTRVNIDFRDYSTPVNNSWMSRVLLENDNNGSYMPPYDGSVIAMTANLTTIGKSCTSQPSWYVYINDSNASCPVQTRILDTQTNIYTTVARNACKFKAGDTIKIWSGEWACTGGSPQHVLVDLTLIYDN